MAEYDPPNVEEVLDQGLAESRSRLTELDSTEGDDWWNMLMTMASMIGASMGNAKALARAANPLYSSEESLTELAGIWGLTRKVATGATGITIQVWCSTASGTWLGTLQATSADGLVYQATSGGTWSAIGTVDITFDAVGTGAASTKGDGTVYTILSPPVGMDAWGAQDGVPAVYGRDEETDEELRYRLLQRLAGVGNSGSRSNYVDWSSRATNVAEAYVFMAQRSSLSADAVIFGPKTLPGYRWLVASDVTEVEELINGTASTEGLRPVGVDFEAVLPTSQNQAVDVLIYSDAGYGRDWGLLETTTYPNASITSIASDGLSIVTSSNPAITPHFMEAGNRLAVNCILGGSWYHMEVSTVTGITDIGGGHYRIDLDTALSATQKASISGDLYPAGPTTEATVGAIEAAFDALGPADTSPSTRWPEISSENPCDLVLAELNRRVMDVEVESVRRHLDVDWTAPGADLIATTTVATGGALVPYTIHLTTMAIFYNTLND